MENSEVSIEDKLQSNCGLSERSQSAHHENLRQGYLDAMGIQTWYPRFHLNNAAPPRSFDWLKEDAKTKRPMVTPASNPETGLSEIRNAKQKSTDDYIPTKPMDILEQVIPPATPVQHNPKENKPIPQHKKILDGSMSQFRLVVHSINNDCLVITEMPHTGLNQFSRYHQYLLNDILKALKIETENSKPYREFIWPMAQKKGLLSQLDQDDYAAHDAVDAFLNNQFGLTHIKKVLILGQSAARFVIDPEKKFDELRGLKEIKQKKQWYCVSYSLNEMMKQPQLKKEGWHDLSQLISVI